MTHDMTALADRFSDLLARREAELTAVLDKLNKEELAGEEARDREVQDFKDLASRETELDAAALDAERAIKELAQVGAARRRLQEGHYGLCVKCGKPIDLRRLEALPAAARCLTCQPPRSNRPELDRRQHPHQPSRKHGIPFQLQ